MLTQFARYLIKVYQLILSPFIGNQCRYHPTCSSYAHEAYGKFGFIKGSLLTFLRICSCHPYSKRPWTDPVPERFAILDIIRYKQNTSKK
ncbi:MAG: membrane protein insertion efficiency factor YidD [Alphaproteobacteria bacterium]|nr:membrane protein insertion efficiency factor YidD [Alphaproteobacteria bacterium]